MEGELKDLMKENRKYDKLKEDHANIKAQHETARKQIDIKNNKIEKLEIECDDLKQ